MQEPEGKQGAGGYIITYRNRHASCENFVMPAFSLNGDSDKAAGGKYVHPLSTTYSKKTSEVPLRCVPCFCDQREFALQSLQVDP